MIENIFTNHQEIYDDCIYCCLFTGGTSNYVDCGFGGGSAISDQVSTPTPTSTATPKKNRNSQEERRANTRHLQKERTTNKGDSKGTTRVHQTPLDSLTHKEKPQKIPKGTPQRIPITP